MRIGLISDTHIPAMGDAPPPQVARAFAGVDLILHAGHAYTVQCIDWLERIAPVTWTESAVQGSGENLTRTSRAHVIELEGHTIGLIHELTLVSLGDEVLPGEIERHFPRSQSFAAAVGRVFGQPVDTVVFGYTHRAMVETHEGILLVNPGSPNLIGQEVTLGTVAILELTPGRAEATVIDLTALGPA
jgi:putative phosphoesterase